MTPRLHLCRILPCLLMLFLTAADPAWAAPEQAGSVLPIPALIETPALASSVAAGTLPPIAQRIPTDPLVIDPELTGRTFGTSGGMIRTLIAQRRNSRLATVYGYARLVGYDSQRRLVPDIVRSFTTDDERVFTLTLRRGHRWSDGSPFTTDDIRFWWEDVANNPDLSPSGPPRFMVVNGHLPTVEFPGPQVVRFRWPERNPYFLPALAAARPPFIYRPAHYLKQFHSRYTSPDSLAALISQHKVRNWAALFNQMDDMFRMSNPDQPTLQPWMATAEGSSGHMLFRRNPYYHRVDAHGIQLPYTDGLDVTVTSAGLIPAQVATGGADLQAETLSFSQMPVLINGEDTGQYKTRLWTVGSAADIALYPNLNYSDPVWRAVLRDVRFRRALSLGIDRRIINRSLYFGMAREGGVSVLPDSPLYQPHLHKSWATYDPDRARELLDDMGLSRPRGEQYRRLPDGRPLEIVIEATDERPEIADALQIITETWRDIGVRVLVRIRDRDVLRNRVYAGQTMMAVWWGWDNGVPGPDSNPEGLAPMTQENFSWPKWGQYYQTGGTAGEKVTMLVPSVLLDLAREWARSDSRSARQALWTQMLDLHADQVLAIGVVSAAPQPVVISRRLQNVPEHGLWLWDPGSYFGIYRPDEFYFAPATPAPDPGRTN